MRLSLPTLALSALTLAAAQSTRAEIVLAGLQDLTTQCQALVAPAKDLNLLNSAFLILDLGPWATVLNGFAAMRVTTDAFATDVARSPPAAPFTGADAVAITESFHAFSVAQTEVLAALIDAAGGGGLASPALLVRRRVTGELFKLQREVESTFFVVLGTLASGYKGDVTFDATTMRVEFGKAIARYDN